MKTIIILGLFLSLSFTSFSQEISELERKLDSLKLLKSAFQTKIEDIEIESNKIENLVRQIKFEKVIGETFYSVSGTKLIRRPDTYEVLIHLPSNRKVKVLESNAKYYKINYNDSIGWVLRIALISETEKQKIIADKQAKELADKKQYEQNKETFVKKFGSEVAEKILYKRIWLGMTDEMARLSKGSPDKINRSVGPWGVHEQWVYDFEDMYLYFENGILTSWQD